MGAAALPVAGTLFAGGRRHAVSPGTGGIVEAATAADPDRRFTEDLLQNINLVVPRTEGYKWGKRMLFQLVCAPYNGNDMDCPGKYIVTGINEDWKDCPTGPDPARLLTTGLDFDRKTSVITEWVRDEDLTAFVENDLDIDYMRLEARRSPNVAINNLVRHKDELKYQAVNDPQSVFGVNLATLVASESGANVALEQAFMHKWLRGKSDPFSKTYIIPRGTAPDGKGVYETAVFRAKDTAQPTGDYERVLTGILNFSTGDWDRVDSMTNFDAPYSELFAAVYDPGTGLSKDALWKLVNDRAGWASHTKVDLRLVNRQLFDYASPNKRVA